MTDRSAVAEETRFIEDLQKDGNKVWERLWREEVPRMIALARRYGLTEEEAEDVCSETFVRFFRALWSLRPETPLRPFLYRIELNAMLDLIRQHQRESSLPSAEELAEESHLIDIMLLPLSGEAALKEERARLLGEAIEELPERARQVVVLYFLEGLSLEKIAQEMKMPPGSARALLAKAHRHLQTKLAEVLGE